MNEILCVPSATLDRPAGYAPLPEDPDWPLGPWVLPAPSWLPRTPELEADDSWKQVIPYVLCVQAGNVLRYRRPSKGGERRLSGRISIGIGGHVERGDGATTPADTVQMAAWREVQEELRPEPAGALVAWWSVGTIVDPDTPVGRCHVGVAMVALFTRTARFGYSDELLEPLWEDLFSLDDERGEMEGWSRIFLDGIRATGLAKTLRIPGA